MNKPFITCCALLAFASAPLAHAASHMEKNMPAGVRGEILFMFDDASGKLIELAEVMPEKAYAWTPGKGVRSTAEVFLHVASADYGIPAAMGAKLPDGMNAWGLEKGSKAKKDVLPMLKNAIAFARDAVVNTSDADLEQPVELFGMKLTKRAASMLIMAHAQEHLGQMVGYARMNKITPPWTAREQAAAAKKAAEEKMKAGGK